MSHLFFSHALSYKLFGKLPSYGQPPKPDEFGLDETMVIRLISLMSKLLKGPIC